MVKVKLDVPVITCKDCPFFATCPKRKKYYKGDKCGKGSS